MLARATVSSEGLGLALDDMTITLEGISSLTGANVNITSDLSSFFEPFFQTIDFSVV